MDNFEEWKSKLRGLNYDVEDCRETLEAAEARRDKFLIETVGFGMRGLATLEGTIDMISKVIDMKAEKV